MPNDDLDLSLSDEDLKELSETSEEASAPELSLDEQLKKEGLELPAETPEEAKKAFLERAKQYHAMGTKRAQELAAEQARVRNSPEYQAFQRWLEAQATGGAQRPPEPRASDKVSSEDMAILKEVIKEVMMAEVTPTLQRISQHVGAAKLDSLRAQYGEAWKNREPQIAEIMQKYPQIAPEDAFKLARADSVKEEVMRELKDKIRQKREASSSPTGMINPSTVSPASLGDVRKMSREEAWSKAMAQASRELGIPLSD